MRKRTQTGNQFENNKFEIKRPVAGRNWEALQTFRTANDVFANPLSKQEYFLAEIFRKF